MTNESNLPWKLHPSLTQERLGIIAGLICSVRHEVALLHEPNKGDTPWSLGCRAYARACFVIAQAAQFRYREWLRVIEDGGLHFVFTVGGAPLRFYRGLMDESNPRYRIRKLPEIVAQQSAFAFMQELAFQEMVLRLNFETDSRGEVSRISLVRLDSRGNPHHLYDIPIEQFKKEAVPIKPPRDGVQLPPANVGERSNQTKRKA